jgi:hypothetical protein
VIARALVVSLALVLAVTLSACRAGTDGNARRYADQHGRLHAPLQPSDGTANVLVFVTTDCPIANGYAPAIQSIAADYADRPVRLFLVHVDPGVTRAVATDHARSFGYELPILLDPTHALVQATGATITPEAVVVTRSGGMVYRGRIDDWYAALGRKRRFATTHELRDAIDAVLAGEPVPVERTTAVGCFVPDR